MKKSMLILGLILALALPLPIARLMILLEPPAPIELAAFALVLGQQQLQRDPQQQRRADQLQVGQAQQFQRLAQARQQQVVEIGLGATGAQGRDAEALEGDLAETHRSSEP